MAALIVPAEESTEILSHSQLFEEEHGARINYDPM